MLRFSFRGMTVVLVYLVSCVGCAITPHSRSTCLFDATYGREGLNREAWNRVYEQLNRFTGNVTQMSANDLILALENAPFSYTNSETFLERLFVIEGKNLVIEDELARRGEGARDALTQHTRDQRGIYSGPSGPCMLVATVCEGLLARLEPATNKNDSRQMGAAWCSQWRALPKKRGDGVVGYAPRASVQGDPLFEATYGREGLNREGWNRVYEQLNRFTGNVTQMSADDLILALEGAPFSYPKSETFLERLFVIEGKNLVIKDELARRGEGARDALTQHARDQRSIYAGPFQQGMLVATVCEGLLARLEPAANKNDSRQMGVAWYSLWMALPKKRGDEVGPPREP